MGCLSPSAVCIVVIVAFASTFGGLKPASAQTSCPVSLATSNGTVKFSNCTDFRNQGSTLSWSFQPSESNSLGGTWDVAFRTTLLTDSGWAGWGINLNPEGKMTGANALIAFNAANGSNVLPYKLTSSVKAGSSPLVCSPIDIVVLSSGVEIVSRNVTIFASIRLPANLTVIHQVWNRGSAVSDFTPAIHPTTPDAIAAFTTLDIASGAVTKGTVANQDLKNNHGIVNVVAWGILFPIGIMVNRYLRPFTEKLWFYTHVSVQLIGIVLGATGFGMGLKLQEESGNIRYKHRNIGIAMFTFATLQLSALILRPKPDHKLRWYWNGYHHGVGYVILILSIINIFEGFDILAPEKKYKHAYTGVICALAAVALILEIITLAMCLRKRSRSRPERLDGVPKATNGRGPVDLKGPTYDAQL